MKTSELLAAAAAHAMELSSPWQSIQLEVTDIGILITGVQYDRTMSCSRTVSWLEIESSKIDVLLKTIDAVVELINSAY